MQLTEAQILGITTVLKGHHLVLGYLFGSQASKKTGPLSDVDIAILFEPKVPKEEQDEQGKKLFVKLAQTLKTDSIDLVNLASASVLMRYRVAFEGRLLYAKNLYSHQLFQIKSMQQFEDFAPYLKFQTAFALQKLKHPHKEFI